MLLQCPAIVMLCCLSVFCDRRAARIYLWGDETPKSSSSRRRWGGVWGGGEFFISKWLVFVHSGWYYLPFV